jgi:predicted alternative tryptophan synthase beta-subunit
MACNFFDLDLEIYMVKVSYSQKPYRRIITLAPERKCRCGEF